MYIKRPTTAQPDIAQPQDFLQRAGLLSPVPAAFHRTPTMHSLKRLVPLLKFSLSSSSSSLNPRIQRFLLSTTTKKPSSSSSSTGDDEWNDAWETAWLPEDPSATSSTADVIFPSSADVPTVTSLSEIDADTKAFVAEMDERWTERRAAAKISSSSSSKSTSKEKEEKRKDVDEYRLKKQMIHAGLWMKEIEKMEEAKVGRDSDLNSVATSDDIDRLLDSCSEIFDSGNIDLNDSKIPSTYEFKSKPDGWETATKSQDGNIWEISQREEDILLQEFERRIAFSKFQIASFIKSHIFSRRRPIDGWKYMIEELGPNARRGKGSVQRLPSLVDPSTQPYKEEKPAISSNFTSYRGR